MKAKLGMPYLVLFALVISCSCSQTDESKAKQKVKKEDQEEVVKKEQRPAFFPIIVAGSLSLIQKIYLKKAD